MSNKLFIHLTDIEDKINDEKELILNNKKMVEYLFNKPLMKIEKWTNRDDVIRNVFMSNSDSVKLTLNLFTIMELYRQYQDTYDSYHNNKSINVKPKRNLLWKKLSVNERYIFRLLYKLEDKYKISFMFKWSFQQEGDHTSTMKAATVNFDGDLEYDFYVIMIYDNRLIQFVIEYDKSDDDRSNDSFKEYCLFQMNIHLLRLNNKSNIKKEIVNFIRTIRSTKTYVTKNCIEREMIDVSDEVLEQFESDYKYNHVIYLKNPMSKIDLDIEEEFPDDDPDEETYQVSGDFFKQIVKQKIKVPIKKPRPEIDNMEIELIGRIIANK
jgi:hypothetical protein